MAQYGLETEVTEHIKGMELQGPEENTPSVYNSIFLHVIGFANKYDKENKKFCVALKTRGNFPPLKIEEPAQVILTRYQNSGASNSFDEILIYTDPKDFPDLPEKNNEWIEMSISGPWGSNYVHIIPLEVFNKKPY